MNFVRLLRPALLHIAPYRNIINAYLVISLYRLGACPSDRQVVLPGLVGFCATFTSECYHYFGRGDATGDIYQIYRWDGWSIDWLRERCAATVYPQVWFCKL
jgi:hypothetical protein